MTAFARIELRRDAGRFDHRSGPWIRDEAVARVLGAADPSELVQVVDARGNVLGYGTYSPQSKIRVRMVSVGEDAPASDWLSQRIKSAITSRQLLGLQAQGTTGYREINSEGDSLPGLVVDRYDACRVVQISTAAMSARQGEIVKALRGMDAQGGCADKALPLMVLMPSAALQREELSGEGIRDDEIGEDLVWRECGLSLCAKAPPGQKTGAYHDQRENRRRVAALARATGGPLLDLGAHIGGFSLHAAREGVAALACDTSDAALEYARRNAAANGLQVDTLQCDMFDGRTFRELDALAGPFGTVVFDPPKLAPTRREVDQAAEAMTKTLTRLMSRVQDAGLLIACSCSQNIPSSTLEGALAAAALRSSTRWTRIARWGAGPDHPVALGHVQGDYLSVLAMRRLT